MAEKEKQHTQNLITSCQQSTCDSDQLYSSLLWDGTCKLSCSSCPRTIAWKDLMEIKMVTGTLSLSQKSSNFWSEFNLRSLNLRVFFFFFLPLPSVVHMNVSHAFDSSNCFSPQFRHFDPTFSQRVEIMWIAILSTKAYNARIYRGIDLVACWNLETKRLKDAWPTPLNHVSKRIFNMKWRLVQS